MTTWVRQAPASSHYIFGQNLLLFRTRKIVTHNANTRPVGGAGLVVEVRLAVRCEKVWGYFPTTNRLECGLASLTDSLGSQGRRCGHCGWVLKLDSGFY